MEFFFGMSREDRIRYHEERVKKNQVIFNLLESIQKEDFEVEDLKCELSIVKEEIKELEGLINALESPKLRKLLNQLEIFESDLKFEIRKHGDLLVLRRCTKDKSKHHFIENNITSIKKNKNEVIKDIENIENKIVNTCNILGTPAKPFLRMYKLKELQ